MANSNAMLDFAIGMISLFLVASLMAMVLQECIAQFLNKRAELLKETIERILKGGKTGVPPSDFFRNPLMSALKTREDGPGPSYVPRDIFVEVVKAHYLQANTIHKTAAAIVEAAQQLPADGSLGQRVLKQAAEQVGATVESIDKAIGDWFDAVMDRVSGTYKRWTQLVVFGLGFAVALAGNLDALSVANYLANSPAARAQFAERMAEAVGKISQPDKDLQAKIERVACDTGLPIGWGHSPSVCKPNAPKEEHDQGVFGIQKPVIESVLKMFGFLITALATTIGAAFWFDLLKRFVNIRAAGPLGSPRSERAS